MALDERAPKSLLRAFDYIATNAAIFIVMEYIDGENMHNAVRRLERQRERFSERRCVRITSQVLSVMEYLHHRGIIHRDMKPANLIRLELGNKEAIKVADFGLIKLQDIASRMGLTKKGDVLGTPVFMSPEQFVDASVADARSDQYSVAATLYYLLTGSLVRRFPSVLPDRQIRTLDDQQSLWAMQGAMLQTTQGPDPIASHRTDISPALWKAIQKALSFQPERRFETCGEFADALRQAVGASQR